MTAPFRHDLGLGETGAATPAAPTAAVSSRQRGARGTLSQARARIAPPLSAAIVYIAVGAAAIVLVTGLAIAIHHEPIVGAVLLAFTLGGAVGAWFGDRARAVYRDIAYWSGERMDAWRAADTATDLDVVGPIRPERPAVDQ